MRPTSEFLYDMIHRSPKVKFNLAGSTPLNLFTAEELAIRTALTENERVDTQARLEQKKLRLLELDGDRHAITFSCGSSQAFSQVLATVTEPNDTVVMESPTYEPFVQTAKFLGLKVRAFSRTGVFEQDFKNIKKLAGKNRVLILTNPHFPLAKIYSEAELRKLAPLFKYMLIDEVFLPMFTVGRATSFTSELPKNTIVTGSYSKSLGLGPLRVGWIATNKKLADPIERIGYHFHIEMPLPNLLIVERALELWQTKIENLEAIARPNREFLLQWVQEQKARDPRFRFPFSHDLSHGHFAMLHTPRGGRRLVKELVPHDIYLRDGAIFGLLKHVRIHWLLNHDDFKMVWEKISAHL